MKLWQTLVQDLGILELGTFLGTILEERQTLAIFNDFSWQQTHHVGSSLDGVVPLRTS
jgi:hypothetical protein